MVTRLPIAESPYDLTNLVKKVFANEAKIRVEPRGEIKRPRPRNLVFCALRKYVARFLRRGFVFYCIVLQITDELFSDHHFFHTLPPLRHVNFPEITLAFRIPDI